MNDFAEIDSVEKAIRHTLIPRYGLSPKSSLTLLAISENANFAVVDPESEFDGVFRIHRRGYHRLNEIQSELQWMQAIRHDTNLCIPAPIPAMDGELVTTLPVGTASELHSALFTRVSGRNLTLADATPDVYRRLGAMNAALHQHAKHWNRPAGFSRYCWDLDAMLGPGARFGQWSAHPRLTDSDRRLLHAAADVVEERINRFSAMPDTIGLAHTDLHVLNLMVDGPDLWAIDFDDCGISWYMQDIAPALACFEDGPAVEELAEAWLHGYQGHTPLNSADRNVWRDFVMLRRLLLLGWSATHPLARIPGIDNEIVAVTTTAAESYLRIGVRPFGG